MIIFFNYTFFINISLFTTNLLTFLIRRINFYIFKKIKIMKAQNELCLKTIVLKSNLKS